MEAEEITFLRFTDDIEGLAGEEDELAKLAERLDKASTSYGMEISADETKLMTNKTSGINPEIKVNGQKLETVTSFKFLGLVITDEGSKPEILSRVSVTYCIPDSHGSASRNASVTHPGQNHVLTP